MFTRYAIFGAFIVLQSTTYSLAGDTAVVNMPGGATQSVFSSVIAVQFPTSPATPSVSVDSPSGTSGDSSTDVTSSIPNGGTPVVTVSTSSGQVFTMSRGFVSSLISSYVSATPSSPGRLVKLD